MLTANILHTLLDQGQSAPLCFRTPPASRIDLRYWLRADVVPCSTFKRSDLTPRSLQGQSPVARCVSGEGRLRVDCGPSCVVGESAAVGGLPTFANPVVLKDGL
jgi:hypothetical protein